MEYILQIPLSIHGEKDELIWHYTPKGYFKVSSAYRLVVHQNMENHVGGSSGPSNWSLIFCLPLQHKIKIFAWQLCYNVVFARLKPIFAAITYWRMTPIYFYTVTLLKLLGHTRNSFLLGCTGKPPRGSISFICSTIILLEIIKW